MPELYDDVKEKPAVTSPEEGELIGKLFEYLDPKNNPWQADYHETLTQCYDFKELRQWTNGDMELLGLDGVPPLPVDRIGRVRDVVIGVRTNTGNVKRIVRRELGDERVASILDDVKSYVEYNGGFDEIRDEAFESQLDCGMGIRKLGFDKSLSGGQGDIWSEYINTEDCGWSPCKSKELEDVQWIWQRTRVSWEEAMSLAPEKASAIKTLRTLVVSKWEELKGGSGGSNPAKDYGGNGTSEPVYGYPHHVLQIEFWIKRRIPYKKIGSVQVSQMIGPGGVMIQLPQPIVTKQPVDYELQEGERELSVAVEEFFEQYVVISGGDKQNAVLIKTGRADDHPFVGMCAERKKSGQPMGLVERLIPHQKRKNAAWAQKTAYNNHAIKSPLVVKGGNPDDEVLAQQSEFGSILRLRTGEELVQVNVQPNVNLQAIEEGQAADRDMDFAAAASEPVLRGTAGSSTSGIQLVRQQDAAVTPLNKWVRADALSEKVFGRKLLRLILQNFPPDRMARIVGVDKFWGTLGYVLTPQGPAPHPMAGQMNPMTGVPVPPPVPLPLSLDVEKYDVEVEDKSINDFNKQQTFNAVEAMVQGGVFFTDGYRIKNAPIKDVDGAIESNQQARMDIIRQLMGMVQQLQGQLQQTEKLVPKENRPAQQGQRGKAAPQAGKNSMVGGGLGVMGG